MSVPRIGSWLPCCALVARAGAAEMWTEVGDAGSFPDSPDQITRGAGGLTSIVGSTGGSDLRDAYCIKIVNPESFLATTDPDTDPGASGDFGARADLVHAPDPAAGRFDSWEGGAPATGTYTVVLAGVGFCQSELDAVFANFMQRNRVCLGDGAGGSSSCTDVSAEADRSYDVQVGELGPFVPPIFADGFESGDTSAWSSTVP